MSMTPLSWNSSQRSLPSRVRSPTPANTDTPPCFMAMLWISSRMMTVLPTPAPPNRPILPPCRYGSSRSMTLMPVSNICSSVDCSSSVGRRRGGSASAPSTAPGGPGSPPARRARSCTRPSVAGPTGTEIGAPVSIDRHAALHAVGRLHRDRAHAVLAEVLLDFGDDVDRLAAVAPSDDDAHGVVDRRQVPACELDVDDRADDLDDLADFAVPLLLPYCSFAASGRLTSAPTASRSTAPARPRPLR